MTGTRRDGGMLRVLVVSNTPFLPAIAGNRARIARMLEFLSARGHAVGMCLLPDVDAAGWDLGGMRARVAWLEVASGPDGPAHRLRSAVARAARRLAPAARPIGVDAWCPPAFRALVRARAAAWRPDVVLVEYVFLSACLEGLEGAVRVIDTHDVMHRRPDVYRTLDMPPQWFHTTRDDERRGLLRADLLLAIQPEEAAALGALVPERRVLTVPHAHPVAPAPPSAARPGRVLLVASYNDVNVRAIEWLADAVWPALRAAVPAAELVVCGNVAEKLGALPPGMTVRGVVSALDAEYAAARVALCPTLAGTGIAVKAVEALCHGRPVVSTRPAAAGLDTGESHGVLVADAAGAFAQTVAALLSDDARWARAAAGAAAQAERRFAPEVAFGPLVAELERSVASRRS